MSSPSLMTFKKDLSITSAAHVDMEGFIWNNTGKSMGKTD